MELERVSKRKSSYFFNFEDDMLLSSKIGDMTVLNLEGDSATGPVIYIKENISKIISFDVNSDIEIEFKIKRIKADDVELILLLVRINKSDDLIYGQWFNLLNKTDVFNLIDLNYINKTVIRFVNYKNEVVNEVIIRNTLKDKIKTFIVPRIYSAKWSTKSFEEKVSFINSTINDKSEMYHSRKRCYRCSDCKAKDKNGSKKK